MEMPLKLDNNNIGMDLEDFSFILMGILILIILYILIGKFLEHKHVEQSSDRYM